VIQEIDWSIGQILETLKELGLDNRTLVIFTSDNGPWLTQGEAGGSARPLRDGKMTAYEGGQRVPCLVRWPGTVPGGRDSDEIVGSIDWVPTLARLAGADLPTDRTLDGIDVWPLLSGETEESSRDHFILSRQVIRKGPWKFFLAGEHRESVPKNGTVQYDHPRLFDLRTDVGERRDVHADHPEVVAELTRMLEDYKADLKANARPVGTTAEFDLSEDLNSSHESLPEKGKR
jgi:arylsulfatase A-like enzyme